MLAGHARGELRRRGPDMARHQPHSIRAQYHRRLARERPAAGLSHSDAAWRECLARGCPACAVRSASTGFLPRHRCCAHLTRLILATAGQPC